MLSKEPGKKIFYIDIPQEDTRKGMKKIAMENWFIDATMAEFNCIVRAGYASQNDYCSWTDYRTKASPFAEFAKDYSEFFW